MNAVSFYKGEVLHRRHSGPAHKLRYRTAYVLVDLDRFEAANQQSRFLGIGKSGLMSIRARDHGDGASDDLAAWVREIAIQSSVDEPCDRVELLTLPRMFGFVFNPISVYFLYGKTERPHHIIYEVNNTFGGRHFYIAPVGGEKEVIKQSCEKALYVSPFFDVEGRYEFSVRPPSDRFSLVIDYRHPDQSKAMTARLFGRRMAVSDRSCLGILASFPLMTLGVITAIHWEALKLFIKGARYRAEPSVDRKARKSKKENENHRPKSRLVRMSFDESEQRDAGRLKATTKETEAA